MRLFTGNFGNVKKYEENGYFPISIALSARYFSGLSYKKLAPEWKYMNDTTESYTKKFNSGLSKLVVRDVLEDLRKFSGGQDVVLLCHEKEGDFCHRRLVAKWITDRTGIKVPELGRLKTVAPKPRQYEMF